MSDKITTTPGRSILSELPSSPANTIPTLMVTWSIGDQFGGMTAMCLRRASIFVQQGIPSAVITFDPNPDYAAVHRSLVSEGRLDPAVPILNIHDYYATHTPATPAKDLQPTDTSGPKWVLADTVKRPSDSTVFYKDYVIRDSADVKRREYYRPDGTLYLVDCTLPTTGSSPKTHRVLQLFRRGRLPVVEFSSAAQLYRQWLSELIGDVETNVIVDSKYSAAFLSSWKHSGAIKVFVFHSPHISSGQDHRTGKLAKGHVPVIDSRTNWDGLIFLTAGQRQAFTSRLGDQGNALSVGNPVDSPANLPDRSTRDLTKVVYMGRLAPEKNVDHVIDIVHNITQTGQPISLEIIGDGPMKEELEQQVRDLGLGDVVAFTGHIRSAASHLLSANVLLLCSNFEGQSLAILEAQAHGCIPVAYDVDFGPREIIAQGETGFLAPAQDKAAATATVMRLLGDDELCARISQQAFEHAQHSNPESIFGQWTEALTQIRQNKAILQLLSRSKPAVTGMHFLADGQLSLDIAWNSNHIEFDSLELRIVPRDNDTPSAALTIAPEQIDQGRAGFLVPGDLRTVMDTTAPLDLHVTLRTGSATRSVRLGPAGPVPVVPYLTVHGNLSIK